MRERPRPWGIVGALAMTSVTGYGIMFYSFAVFLDPMRRDLRAGSAETTVALTVAILVSACAAPVVGRLLDRYGGRALMTTGSVLGTAAVFCWSKVTSLAGLYAVFSVIGLAMACSLYESAFAVIVTWFDEGRRRATAILVVTVVGGLASTVFLPFSGILTERYGWRDALVVLTVVLGALTIPAHLLAVRRGPGVAAAGPPRGAVSQALRGRSFWLMTLTFVSHNGAVYTLGVHLVACLTALGHTRTFATVTAGLLGVLSVTGRLTTTGLQRRVSPTAIACAMFTVQAAGAALLPWLGRSAAGAVICVLLFGIGYGVGTITRPVLIAQHFARESYGSVAGAIALPVTFSTAVGPLAAAALAQLSGYTPVALAIAACCLTAATGLLLLRAGQRGPAREERERAPLG
ncbi:MFS transporter [Streptosporangium carneum]|uniref:MFS transporter n=1 Tax=Streptosporangium carneum TaxID=47481 RepID=A0A9W6I7T3_9ACTN|nr:MFS transporter [Streptosporangium carneum]GLK13203.1 MFS transporter [Streptosporangium carneum]